MAHVFISYAHEDGDFGDVLINKLKESGITHWVDSEHLRAGEDWRQAIDDAIRNAVALIVIMSPAAKASEYVTYEWAFAWGIGVKVIPVLYKQAALHPRLEAWQYLDFTHRSARPWDKLFSELSVENSRFLKLNLGHKNIAQDLELESRELAKKHVKVLQESSSYLKRRDAAKALGTLRNSLAVPTLLLALNDPYGEVRVVVAWALGQIGHPSAIPNLEGRLKDSEIDKITNTSVAITSLEALERIGTPEALAAVEEWRRQQKNTQQ